MPNLHLVERKNNVSKVQNSDNEWESGYWVVSDETAQKLVGGNLYLHEKQSAPSHFGGTITGYRVFRDSSQPEVDGRVIFRIKAAVTYRGIKTGREGWGNEKKIEW